MAGKTGKRISAHIVIDVMMAVCLVAVMSTALVQEAPHEYLGILLAILVIAHIVMNRRWFTRLTQGRYNALRVAQIVSVAGLALCLIGQVASALILSKHALWFLPTLPGASWARSIHMLCSYWMFVFAFAHAGLQLGSVLARTGFLRKAPAGALWALRIVWAVAAALGVLSFAQLGVGDYLLGRVQFASVDYDAPIALSFARFASVAVLIAGAFYYLALALGGKRRSHGRADRVQ